MSITIVQSGDHILNTFQEGSTFSVQSFRLKELAIPRNILIFITITAISQYAEERFKRHDINVITNARVVSVEPGVLTYRKKKVAKGEQDTFEYVNCSVTVPSGRDELMLITVIGFLSASVFGGIWLRGY